MTRQHPSRLFTVLAPVLFLSGCNQFERIESSNPDFESFFADYEFENDSLAPYRVEEGVVSLFLKPHGGDDTYDLRLAFYSPKEGSEVTVTHLSSPQMELESVPSTTIAALRQVAERAVFTGHDIVASSLSPDLLLKGDASGTLDATVTVTKEGSDFAIPFSLRLETQTYAAPLR